MMLFQVLKTQSDLWSKNCSPQRSLSKSILDPSFPKLMNPSKVKTLSCLMGDNKNKQRSLKDQHLKKPKKSINRFKSNSKHKTTFCPKKTYSLDKG